MSSPSSIKKPVTIFLYLVTLYYLLPFRPGYLYYVSLQKSAVANSNCNKKGELHNGGGISFENGKIFTAKDRSRFDFDGSILIPTVQNEFDFSLEKIASLHFIRSEYSSPLTLCNSNRGPPNV